MSINDKAKLATWFYWVAMILLNLGWLVLFWDVFVESFTVDEAVPYKHILMKWV